MGAVLDVTIRPEFFSELVVAFVEQRIERFEDNCLIMF